MSTEPDDHRRDELPTHIPTQDSQSNDSPAIGATLSFISLIMLAFILRLAVPKEDSAVQLGVLLVAVGFAQVWLIFNFLKSFKK